MKHKDLFVLHVNMLFIKLILKVSSRVKNHHFSKFASFRRLNRAHQELSLKKSPGKMFFLCRLMECRSFFYANYFN